MFYNYLLFATPEQDLLDGIVLGMIALSIPILISLLFVKAPYGRYASGSSWLYGFDVNGKLAWILQECPTVIWGIYLILTTPNSLVQQNTANLLLFLYFMFHYVYRSFIFPFLLRGVKPTPFFIMLSAFVFCFLNGYLQVRSLTYYNSYDDSWLLDPRFIIGSILFWLGLLINHHSDYVLRNLRKPGETDYKIPRGGAFRFVSAANYFGEIVEWFGFAIATWSLAGLAFAIFTFSNIGPRGYQHHQGYLKRFKNYPKERKAVIPFIW